MSNLTQRLITGTIFVIVLVGAIWFSAWTMALLFLVITILGLSEFYRLSEKAGAKTVSGYAIFVAAITILLLFFIKAAGFNYRPVLFVIPFYFLIFFIELYRKQQNPLGNIAWTFLGFAYVLFPMVMLILSFTPRMTDTLTFLAPELKAHEIYNPRPVLALFVLIWVSDSMAYVCGRMFGKNKLWERISPKKTWEGFIGGMIFCAGTGFAFGHWMMEDNETMRQEIIWTLVAVVTAVTGMLGDLVESMFKRSIDVKDSGNILPGHGGILDRFDALFLSVPFTLTTYWLSTYFTR